MASQMDFRVWVNVLKWEIDSSRNTSFFIFELRKGNLSSAPRGTQQRLQPKNLEKSRGALEGRWGSLVWSPGPYDHNLSYGPQGVAWTDVHLDSMPFPILPSQTVVGNIGKQRRQQTTGKVEGVRVPRAPDQNTAMMLPRGYS